MKDIWVRLQNAILKRRAWVIAGMLLLMLFVPACIRALMNNCWIADKGAAREQAKSAILREWKKFDPALELVDITYESVTVNEMNAERKAQYLAENGNVRFSKDGVTYPNLKAYLDEIYYNMDTNIWRMYIVKGTYRVADKEGNEYSGSFRVRIASLTGLHWSVEIPEIPALDVARGYP